MKSLLSLSIAVCRDVGALCDVDAERDILTLSRRVEKEGVSFLEITLPTFADAFEGALASGRWQPSACKAFRHARGTLPLFLRGFVGQVFDDDGVLKADASSDAVFAVRQICRLHKKVFAVCAERYAQRSIKAFVQCEEEMGEYWYPPATTARLSVSLVRCFGDQLSKIEQSIARGTLIPRHGPGATADHRSGNGKWDFDYWPKRLEAVAPADEFIRPSWSMDPGPVLSSSPEQERPVRVVTVPKTANKARIIAVEPCSVQYAQQALLREFMREFSGGAPFVDLRDQEPNRRLAYRGSIDGSLATIDLSEASDRVGMDLVRSMFSRFPLLLRYLEGTRSTWANVPGYGVIPLSKFASMGSALCFPVESIVFATIVLHAAACARFRTLSPSKRELLSFRNDVRVFGDDIVVPTAEASACLRLLVQMGARPNPTKTFRTGSFRESCGKDYWKGVDVTVTYRRSSIPETRRQAQELASTVSLRNQLYWAGCWRAADCLDRILGQLIPLPNVAAGSAVMGRESIFGFEVQRWHSDYQSPLVRGATVVGDPPSSRITEQGALLKCLIPGRDEPFADVRHLERGGRPRTLRTKVRWGSPV